MTTDPTLTTYTSLASIYDFFNRELFSNTLPPCLITVQRHKGAYGYFSPRRFINTADQTQTDEIALNPQHFKTRPMDEVLSTLVHEMCHLWQEHHGKPPRRAYHDKQFAAKMREIGLICSATGQQGGKETGQKMTHYIEYCGAYWSAYRKLVAERGELQLYHDTANDSEAGKAATKKKQASKTKYTCSACGANAWAKPKSKLVCGECYIDMEGEDLGDDEESED